MFLSAVRVSLRSHFAIVSLGVALLSTTAVARASSESSWTDATKDELSAAWKPLDAQAAVEVLNWRIDVDDHRYPRDRRTAEYIRYKILIPDKADKVTRVSRIEVAINGQSELRYDIRARLTQPDGTVKLFGKEAILTRPASKTETDSADAEDFGSVIERTEKYLVVSGAKPGSIVEVRIDERDLNPDSDTDETLQLEDIPVRDLEYTFRSGSSSEYNFGFFVLNTSHAKFTEDDKHRIYTVTGHDLPGLVDEPYSGPKADYALTAMCTYIPYDMSAYMTSGSVMPTTIDTKAGPWAVYSSVARIIEEDRSAPTRAVKKAAAELVQGAKDQVEAAARIHRKVRALYQQFVHRAKSRKSLAKDRDINPSLDRALDLDDPPNPDLRSDDFLYLELSLLRAAGLHAELLLLPDRSRVRFDPKTAAPAFLPDWCAAIRIGETWHFSNPISKVPLPFDELSWFNEGQDGLLAREDHQDFIPVPLQDAGSSVVASYGLFSVDASGTLLGDFRIYFTGQEADRIRGKLRDQDSEHQQSYMKSWLGDRFAGADVKVVSIGDVDAPEKPVQVTYHVNWPGYAVLTADRLILQPSVFRAHAAPPFTASQRTNWIMFPFRRTEMDRLAIQLPDGYAPESMSAPPSYPGDALGYRVGLSFDPSKRTLNLQRQLQSAIINMPPQEYTHLKQWFDAVASSDQQELVFIKSAPAATAKPATP